MSRSVLDMSVSVDGFVADANDYLGGEDGERLHAWADSPDPSRPIKQFEDEWNAAGAILAGRRVGVCSRGRWRRAVCLSGLRSPVC